MIWRFEPNVSNNDMESNGTWIKSLEQRPSYHCLNCRIHKNNVITLKLKLTQTHKSTINIGLIPSILDLSALNSMEPICTELDRLQSAKKWLIIDQILIYGFLRQAQTTNINHTIPKDIIRLILSNYMHHVHHILNKTHQINKEIHQQTIIINNGKSIIEDELDEAKPAMDAAIKAVSNVQNKQLIYIPMMRNPPKPIRMTWEAVAILLGVKWRNWKDIARMIKNSSFREKIRDFDPHSIKDKTRKIINKNYLSDVHFTFEHVNRASTCTAPFVLWVSAMVKYKHLLDAVEPMQREINELCMVLKRKEEKLMDIIDKEYELLFKNKYENDVWERNDGYLIYNEGDYSDIVEVIVDLKESKIGYKVNENDFMTITGIDNDKTYTLGVVLIGECEIQLFNIVDTEYNNINDAANHVQ